ncbi:hypothetical protein FGB62_170g06 [Gracilaria domingensis]|nr:hypothetical protein FGB62_170g06 [Gracilaria domingensis]
MKQTWSVLVISTIWLFQLTQGSPGCNAQLQLSIFLSGSYTANANLVRFGVPSEAVSTFYNTALKYLAQNCKCSPTLLDEPCVDTKFNSDKEVTALRALLDSDETVADATKLFRLYDSQKTLNPLTNIQEQKLQLGLDLLNTNTHDLDIILSWGWQRVQFPSDDSFFQDDSSEQATACSTYDSLVQPGVQTYPASAATAYVLSLVQNVRRAGGDLTVAYQFLANHTAFVFDGVRCHKLSGDKLKIPINYMNDYKDQTHLLLKASGSSTSSVDLNDVRKNAGNAKLYLYPLVTKFSSLISYGDSETVLYTNTELLACSRFGRKKVSGRSASE